MTGGSQIEGHPGGADLTGGDQIQGHPGGADLTGGPVFSELAGQDAVVGQAGRRRVSRRRRSCGQGPGQRRRIRFRAGDGARVALHRAARVWPLGRCPRLRRRAALRSSGLWRVLVVPPGRRGDPRRPAAGTPGRPVLRRAADQGPGAARRCRAGVRTLAGGLFEDADRATEQAANALLKAIEEPSPRTVWLLCAPSAADLPTTIRSRCRLITLRTPPTSASLRC